MNDVKIRMLPEAFVCPQCNASLQWESHVSGDESRPLQNGDIIICGKCVRTLQLRDDKLKAMTKDEIMQLHTNARTTLKLAIIGVMEHNSKKGNN